MGIVFLGVDVGMVRRYVYGSAPAFDCVGVEGLGERLKWVHGRGVGCGVGGCRYFGWHLSIIGHTCCMCT